MQDWTCLNEGETEPRTILNFGIVGSTWHFYGDGPMTYELPYKGSGKYHIEYKCEDERFVIIQYYQELQARIDYTYYNKRLISEGETIMFSCEEDYDCEVYVVSAKKMTCRGV